MSLCRLSTLAVAAGLTLVLGCGTKVTSKTTSTGAGGATSTGTAATGTSSGTTGSGGAPPGTTALTASIGPIHVTPGEESVQCIVMNLGNTDASFVRRFKTTLATGTHHMIVYTTTDPENLTPTPCQSFAGILTDHPIFIAQQAHSELDFPTDAASGSPVGLQLKTNQMLRLEMHFINPTMTPLDVTGTAEIDVLPSTANVIKSDLAFWGTEQFTIPPNADADTGMKFHAALPGTHVFALTTHQHQLGTEMQVWYADSVADTSNRVADGTNWSNPPLELFSPPLDFPVGSTKGFAYDCHWKNTTSNQVNFGEGFNNEMCFLWHYYYPSQGFQYCVDNVCATKP